MLIAQKLNNVELPKGGVFSILSKAGETEKKFGKNKVITAVIGSLFDENEKFFTLNNVEETYKKLDAVSLFNYAPAITGTEEFKNLVKQNVFGKHIDTFKNSFINVCSTAGGTGAVGNTIRAFLDKGQTLLLPNIRWESYSTMAESNELNCVSYNLFKDNVFDITDFSNKVLENIKKDKKIAIVINDPCHNPTGYSLTMNEWKQVINVLKEASKIGDVVLCNDIAYIDYDYRGQDNAREYMKLFNGLPENILVVIAFSISKSLTSYGLRVGASIAISSSEKVIKEVDNVFGVLCRSTWSNISRGGMQLFIELNKDKTLFEKLNKERQEMIDVLKKRTDGFIDEAKKVGLEYLPYRGGFFFTIPVKDHLKNDVLMDLQNKNVFVVPVDNGLRVAVCSTTIAKSKMLPRFIKDSIEKITAGISDKDCGCN